jgi:hypothetical protein
MTATKRFGCGEGPQAKREGMTGLRKPQRPLRVANAKSLSLCARHLHVRSGSADSRHHTMHCGGITLPC